jgi:hypothetical protein
MRHRQLRLQRRQGVRQHGRQLPMRVPARCQFYPTFVESSTLGQTIQPYSQASEQLPALPKHCRFVMCGFRGKLVCLSKLVSTWLTIQGPRSLTNLSVCHTLQIRDVL